MLSGYTYADYNNNSIVYILHYPVKTQDTLRYLEDKLKDVVGMVKLKDDIRECATNMIGNQIISRTTGRKVGEKRPVMLFSGNPGTGKTFIAYIVAGKYLFNTKNILTR